MHQITSVILFVTYKIINYYMKYGMYAFHLKNGWLCTFFNTKHNIQTTRTEHFI